MLAPVIDSEGLVMAGYYVGAQVLQAARSAARYVIAKAISHDVQNAHALAVARWPGAPETVALKAAVAAGSTLDPNSAAPLAEFQSLSDAFIAYQTPYDLIDQL